MDGVNEKTLYICPAVSRDTFWSFSAAQSYKYCGVFGTNTAATTRAAGLEILESREFRSFEQNVN